MTNTPDQPFAADMLSKSPQTVAVLGATGQVGFPLCRELRALGQNVLAVSRERTPKNSPKLDALENLGVRLAFLEDLSDINALADILQGCDALIVALRANVDLVRTLEPKILQAAAKAGIKRFIPDEFGVHTKSIEYGAGTLFDAKKDLHTALFASGLQWTMIYPGGIFDYFLPNFRMFHKVTTFGDLECRFPTHHIDDIAAIAARAAIDERTANKCVQLNANMVTQSGLLQTLREQWPEHQFETEHISSETIMHLKDHADPDKISAKGGAETDRERYGINYVVYVQCRLANLDDPDTLSANELYPDYTYIKPEEMLADRKFVFGDKA